MINVIPYEWYGLGMAVTSGLISAGLTTLWIPRFCNLLQQAGWVKPNYQGRIIPIAAGTALIAAFSATVMFLIVLARIGRGIAFPKTDMFMPSEQQLLLILMLSFGMGLLGLFDDLLGSRSEGGLKGHFRKWVKEGELTTGVMKAIGGGCLSLCAAMLGNSFMFHESNPFSIPLLVVDGMVIALLANWINLLDVRPGRALKAVLLKIGLLLPLVPLPLLVPLLTLTGVVVGYFRIDLRAKAMMGDAGANFLGAVLGYLLVQTLDTKGTLYALAALVFLHAYTETHSLSKLIEGNRVLGWLDEWGREEAR